jgi:DNA-directed RNA polymerase specialized sigma24 family protein
VSVFSDLRRRRADDIIRRDYEGLRRVVLSGVRGQLARRGVEMPDAELDAAYNVAWQGLYAQLLEGDEIKNLAGFLVTVTTRRAIDEYRKVHVARRADDVEVGDQGHDPDLAERLDDFTKLQHFIEGLKDRLDQRERQAVTLCYIQGLSRKEAAQILRLSDKRMNKVMDGLASRIGDFVRAIESGLWCEERGSLMRAYALHILAPDGERQALAREHLAACSGCRAYVRSLRGLAAAMPPVALPAGGASTGFAGFLDHLQSLVDTARDTLASVAHVGPAEAVVGGGNTATVGAATVAGSGGAVAAAGGGAAVATTGAAAAGAAAGASGGAAAGGVLGGGLAAKAAALAVSVAVAGGATATVTHDRANDRPQRAAASLTVPPAAPSAAFETPSGSRVLTTSVSRAAVTGGAGGIRDVPGDVRRTPGERPSRDQPSSGPTDEFGFEAAHASGTRRADAGKPATEFGFERTDATPASTGATGRSSVGAADGASRATASTGGTSGSATTTATSATSASATPARTVPTRAATSSPSAASAAPSSDEFGFER